jgi:hypothetical protein
MQTYPADARHFQSQRQVLANWVFGWLKRRAEAHREWLTSKRRLEMMRTRDRHILDDMGVDIAALEEIHAKLSKADRTSVFFDTLGSSFRFPSNMSSR